ncbi:MAG: glycoside hydrolase [Candidatus Omnitrophota bacterium]|jgi:formylglycine-generating enzyme required for sulfatase activity|nr:MAG: glycoside hydrolase [Candidatus Omnitrophota bacterium]
MLKTVFRFFLGAFILFSSAYAAESPGGKTYTNSIGMAFARIEPGMFWMGSDGSDLHEDILAAREHGGDKIWLPDKGDFDEFPQHRVIINQPFYIGVCEVTNRQYEQFDPLHMHIRGKKGFSIDNDEAVIFVNWHEAQAFCDWLSKKEGLPYRLPTEAEWEYACRAGSVSVFATGDTLPDEYVKNPDNSWFPCPDRSRNREDVVPLHVGKTRPNAWGLFDMHGNVEEWCHDFYGPYADGEQTDPVGRVDGDFKVTRGGSHGTPAFYLRSANRMGTLADDKSFCIGFRVVQGELPDTNPLPLPPAELHQRNVSQTIPLNLQKGPDPNQPYFKGPREYVKIAENSQGPLFSQHNHDPGIVECPNGDLLAVWYTTVTERGRELGQAASRLRYGADEWAPASPFWDAPDRNDHCPAMWFDGDKTIYHFAGLSTAATWGPLAIIMRTSTDNGAGWSKARLIMPEHQRRNQCVESVFRTREGFIILPCDATPSGNGGTAIHVSRDEGETWSDPGGTIAGIHAAVVQLHDGRLMAFGRGDSIDGHMPKSVSTDMGRTWTYSASEFPPIGGGQRLVLLRLQEGPLLLVSFANGGGTPVLVRDASGGKREIHGMFAAISYDDGETWPMKRLVSDDQPDHEVQSLDDRVFLMSPSVSEPRGYLSVCQTTNGVIHLISSRNHYEFNLKWLETPAPSL